jgi:NTP pyrophosphatase (non-canonical NTP hydrolase)
MNTAIILKVIEECNELSHILCKKLVHLDDEKNKRGSYYKESIEDEVADCLAAIECLIQTFPLDSDFIKARTLNKINYYLTTKTGEDKRYETLIGKIIEKGRKDF